MLTNEQKKLRLEGAGGSEIAAIAGLNPYATALDVYRAKVEGYETPVTAPMERGTFLEDGVARWYAHRTGSQLREVGTIRHPSLARVMCTPDRLAMPPHGSELDLSIKVPGPHVREQWGEAGTDDLPGQYIVQAQWELIVLEAHYGIRLAHVAAPIDGDLRIYTVTADSGIQSDLIELAQRFWRDHIETRTPPPVDGSKSSTRWLADTYPQHRSPLRVATPEANALMKRLQAALELKAEAEAEETATKNALKALLGDAEGMAGEGWRCTWKTTKGSLAVDWEAAAREAGVPEHIIEKHSRITKGSRRFLPTWSEPK